MVCDVLGCTKEPVIRLYLTSTRYKERDYCTDHGEKRLNDFRGIIKDSAWLDSQGNLLHE